MSTPSSFTARRPEETLHTNLELSISLPDGSCNPFSTQVICGISMMLQPSFLVSSRLGFDNSFDCQGTSCTEAYTSRIIALTTQLRDFLERRKINPKAPEPMLSKDPLWAHIDTILRPQRLSSAGRSPLAERPNAATRMASPPAATSNWVGCLNPMSLAIRGEALYGAAKAIARLGGSLWPTATAYNAPDVLLDRLTVHFRS